MRKGTKKRSDSMIGLERMADNEIRGAVVQLVVMGVISAETVSKAAAIVELRTQTEELAADITGTGKEVSSASDRPTKSGVRPNKFAWELNAEKAEAVASSEVGSGGSGNGHSARKSGNGKRGRGRGSSASVTREQAASRKIQGRYLALIRQVPKTRRGEFKRIVKESGREAAIGAINKFLEAR